MLVRLPGQEDRAPSARGAGGAQSSRTIPFIPALRRLNFRPQDALLQLRLQRAELDDGAADLLVR